MSIRLISFSKYVFILSIIFMFYDTLPFSERATWRSFDENVGSNIIRQFILLSTLIYFFILVLKKKIISFPFQLLPLILFLIYSSYMSPVYLSSFKALTLSLICLFTFLYFGLSNGIESMINCFGKCVLYSTLLSLVFAIFVSNSFHLPWDPEPSTSGSLRGLFYHKNILGPVIAFAMIYLYSARNKYKYWKFLLFTCFLTLLLSKSVTSIFSCVFSIILTYLVIRLTASKYSTLKCVIMYLFFSVFIVFVACIINYSTNTGLSLNGRSEIWRLLVDLYVDKPYIGYGFQSLYDGGVDSVFANYVIESVWFKNVASGHSGYLDLIVSIGLVGVLLFFLLFLVPVLNLIYSDIKIGSLDLRFFLISSISFCLLHNVLEASFINKGRPVWIMLCLLYSISFCIKNDGTRYRIGALN